MKLLFATNLAHGVKPENPGLSRCWNSDCCRSWVMGSDSPSGASSCSPGDHPILLERSCSTSNTFLVGKDDWVQGLVLHRVPWSDTKSCPGRFSLLTQPLRLFSVSGLVPGLPLAERPGESTIPNVDGAAWNAAPSCNRPSWGPLLQELC